MQDSVDTLVKKAIDLEMSLQEAQSQIKDLHRDTYNAELYATDCKAALKDAEMYVEGLKDRVEWLDFNLAGANKEVVKGREMLSKLKLFLENIASCQVPSIAQLTAETALKELEAFYDSYID